MNAPEYIPGESMAKKLRLGFEHLEPRGLYQYVIAAEIHEWCKDNLREPEEIRYTHTGNPERYYIHFGNEFDAMYFKLRWL